MQFSYLKFFCLLSKLIYFIMHIRMMNLQNSYDQLFLICFCVCNHDIPLLYIFLFAGSLEWYFATHDSLRARPALQH